MVPARPPGPLGAPPMPPVRPPRCPVPRRRPRRRWLGTAGSRSSHPGTEALARPPARSAPAAPRCTPASPWRRCAPAAVPRPPPRARASHRPRRAPAAGLRPTRPRGSTASDSGCRHPRPGAADRGLSALQPPAAGLTPSAPRPFPEPGPWGPVPAAGGADAPLLCRASLGGGCWGSWGPLGDFRWSRLAAHLGRPRPPVPPPSGTQVSAGNRRCRIKAHGSLALPGPDRRPPPPLPPVWGCRGMGESCSLGSTDCPRGTALSPDSPSSAPSLALCIRGGGLPPSHHHLHVCLEAGTEK